ncbi:unnamed protein product [Arctia plantaginis]|uniref:Uncharacterized protein n=1 Tax=Arctia plantaginis TaxID=874455 RepID=A0A8S1ACU1_ARCPL|nr:unnamed protein product [Arctia plantaginis]
MFSHKFLLFVTLAFCLETLSVYADIDAMTAAINQMSQECGKELGIDPEKVKEFKWDVDYEPCFLNCFYTKYGMLNKGIFDKEKAMDYAKLYVTDETVLAQIKETNEDCTKVNDIDIGDGDTSCKRAALLYKCISSHEGVV